MSEIGTKHSSDEIRTKLIEARRKLRKCRTEIEGHEADINMLAHDEKKLTEQVEQLEVKLVQSDDHQYPAPSR